MCKQAQASLFVRANIYLRERWRGNELVRKKQNCRHVTILKFKRRGGIENKICQTNGCEEKAIIHHWDYDNPLDISFVCPKHHLEIHTGSTPEGIFRHF